MNSGQKTNKRAQTASVTVTARFAPTLLSLLTLFFSPRLSAQGDLQLAVHGSYFNQADIDSELHGAQIGAQLRWGLRRNSALIAGLDGQLALLDLDKNTPGAFLDRLKPVHQGSLRLHLDGLAYIDRSSLADMYLSVGGLVILHPERAMKNDQVKQAIDLGATMSIGVDLKSWPKYQPGFFLRYCSSASIDDLIQNQAAKNSLNLGLSLALNL